MLAEPLLDCSHLDGICAYTLVYFIAEGEGQAIVVNESCVTLTLTLTYDLYFTSSC